MAQLRPDGLDTPNNDRFDPDHPHFAAAMAAHAEACATGASGYTDPASGLWVMTAPFLAERPCCDQSCRHCPWVQGG